MLIEMYCAATTTTHKIFNDLFCSDIRFLNLMCIVIGTFCFCCKPINNVWVIGNQFVHSSTSFPILQYRQLFNVSQIHQKRLLLILIIATSNHHHSNKGKEMSTKAPVHIAARTYLQNVLFQYGFSQHSV